MDKYLEDYLLKLSKRNFTNHVLILIKAKNTAAILSILSSLLEHPIQQKALYPIYPKLARYIRNIWEAEIQAFPLKTTINTILNNISVGYINHIGCNCHKKINPLYLTTEIVGHLHCPRFTKNIMLHLPQHLRNKLFFYTSSLTQKQICKHIKFSQTQ